MVNLLISAKDCGKLSNPMNGAVRYAGTTFGFEANYSCFIDNSFSKRICGADGKWTGVDPICSKYNLLVMIFCVEST